ncbi:MAG: hypothetical protein EBX63_03510 [Betaproteobacteria bacterium]|nr:hypothetical protein [Betaproteobacteria bacterium]
MNQRFAPSNCPHGAAVKADVELAASQSRLQGLDKKRPMGRIRGLDGFGVRMDVAFAKQVFGHLPAGVQAGEHALGQSLINQINRSLLWIIAQSAAKFCQGAIAEQRAKVIGHRLARNPDHPQSHTPASDDRCEHRMLEHPKRFSTWNLHNQQRPVAAGIAPT